MSNSRRRLKIMLERVPAEAGPAAAKKARIQTGKPQTARNAEVPRKTSRGHKPMSASTVDTAGTPVQFFRRGTKAALILDLLIRPQGAALDELIDTTGWQPHSIRGFLSGISKKMGLAVVSVKKAGKRRYSLEI